MRFIIGLVLVFCFCYGVYDGMKIKNEPVVINEFITQESLTKTWKKIKELDESLPLDEPINLYLNNPGGDAMATVVLLERINILQDRGREFIGTIYGHCFSACGSIFATMDKRYMTANSLYMQHAAYSIVPTPTNIKIARHIDRYRLKSDAYLLNKGLDQLINSFSFSDFLGTAQYMKKHGMIDDIVQQPEMEQI